MRKTLMLTLTLGALSVFLGFGIAAAQTSEIDYVGFGWETGGIPSSIAGDVLDVLAVATQVDPIFGVDLGTAEVTIYIYDLVSTGEIPIGGGDVLIGYIGGSIEVWMDPSQDSDWGVFPPNAQLGTWRNGTLLLEGDFSSFTLQLAAIGAGAYEGNIDGVGGTIAQSCFDCAFTFGGAFTQAVGAQIPDGYHLQVDGILEVLDSVATDDSSWGAVKSLFERN